MKNLLFLLIILFSIPCFSQSDLVVISTNRYNILYRNVSNTVQIAFDGMNESSYKVIGYGCNIYNVNKDGENLPIHNFVIKTDSVERAHAMIRIVRLNDSIYNDTVAEIEFICKNLPAPQLFLGGAENNTYLSLTETKLFAKYGSNILLDNQFEVLRWTTIIGKKKITGTGNTLSAEYLMALKKLKAEKKVTIEAHVLGEDGKETTVFGTYIKAPNEWYENTMSLISKDYQLTFLSYDPEFDMSYNPAILHDGKIESIADYNGKGGPGYFSISPNKKFIILDNINIGYLENEDTTFLHENYFCAIVDVEKHLIVSELQGACGGDWNRRNQFIYAGEVIFDGRKRNNK